MVNMKNIINRVKLGFCSQHTGISERSPSALLHQVTDLVHLNWRPPPGQVGSQGRRLPIGHIRPQSLSQGGSKLNALVLTISEVIQSVHQTPARSTQLLRW